MGESIRRAVPRNQPSGDSITAESTEGQVSGGEWAESGPGLVTPSVETSPSITQHGRSGRLKRPESPGTEPEGTDLVSVKVMVELAQECGW